MRIPAAPAAMAGAVGFHAAARSGWLVPPVRDGARGAVAGRRDRGGGPGRPRRGARARRWRVGGGRRARPSCPRPREPLNHRRFLAGSVKRAGGPRDLTTGWPRTRADRAALLLAGGLALAWRPCGAMDDDGAAVSRAPPRPGRDDAPPASAPAPPPPPGGARRAAAFTAGLQGWDRLNSPPIPPDSPQTQSVGFDAHRGTKNVYMSVPASG